MNLKIKSFLRKLNHIKEEFNHQNNILFIGLKSYKNLLIWLLPIFFTLIFLTIDLSMDISIKSIVNKLTAILPSLTGFLIASLTILISMDNHLLNETIYNKETVKSTQCNPTYRQVGASLFLYSTKISLILLIISFIMPDNSPNFLIDIKIYLIFFIKLLIYILFSKLVISLFYGLLFLSSAIENHHNDNSNN